MNNLFNNSNIYYWLCTFALLFWEKKHKYSLDFIPRKKFDLLTSSQSISVRRSCSPKRIESIESPFLISDSPRTQCAAIMNKLNNVSFCVFFFPNLILTNRLRRSFHWLANHHRGIHLIDHLFKQMKLSLKRGFYWSWIYQY